MVHSVVQKRIYFSLLSRAQVVSNLLLHFFQYKSFPKFLDFHGLEDISCGQWVMS
jgi:hypothetical protein